MMPYFLFLFFLFLCLFALFVLSRHDFVLLRKNISLLNIFDLAIVLLFLSFISGRLLYIFDTQKFGLLHPLLFFHIVRVPGFSFLGAFLGGCMSIPLLFKEKSIVSRLFDIFSLSFFPLFSFSIIIRYFPEKLLILKLLLISLIFIVLFTLFNFYKNYTVKDGSIALLILTLIALDNLILQALSAKKILFLFLSLSQILSIGVIVVCVLLFFLNQNILFKKE